jgi:aerobic carbon-monoxide dehydrogenase large subunit
VTRKYLGQRIKRLEDPRLLTGQALFIDDIELPGMLHAAFKRSDYAHATIKSIDVSEARKLPGVVAVYTAEDFGDYWHIGPLQVPPPSAIMGAVFNARPLSPIAKGKIRYSGEPVAVVIAEDRYIAEDACDLIFLDAEPLDAVTDMEKALEPGSVLVHEDLGTNLAADVYQEKGSYAEAAAKADLVLKRRFHIDRCAGGALENRGIVISWDARAEQMTIWATTQSPISLKNSIAANLSLADSQVRVITPMIGGGFGPKVMTSMPDDVLLPWLSMKLGKPIKWMEDRRENFLATTSERDQLHYSEIAINKDGKIQGIKDVFYHNTGAYDPYGMTVPLNTQTHTMGPYNIPNFYTEVKMVFTNKMVVTPVRGAGRTYGTYVMERLIDAAARKLGLDPVDVRRKNLVQPDQFPFKTGITGQDFVESILDSGNYPETLRKALELSDYEKWIKEEQPKLRAAGKKVGVGVACFIEGTGVGPYEGAKVGIDNSGKVSVSTGISSQGQGHFTVYAQLVAEQLDVPVENIRVTTGDTGVFGWGAGTFASRGATVAGSAINAAAANVRKKALALASKLLNTPEGELEFHEGTIRVADLPEKSITLGELAKKSAPTRGTMEPGTEPGLEAVAYYGPPYGATGQGAMVMMVEVDPETFKVKIDKCAMVHDCGTPLNTLLLEGQVLGGISMGIGTAFYEQLIYDESGQLQNASFMDYLLPTALDMPTVTKLGHIESPSPLNPLGIKGVGEAGAIPTVPCFFQALENALPEHDFEILDAPLSPSRLYHVVKGK